MELRLFSCCRLRLFGLSGSLMETQQHLVTATQAIFFGLSNLVFWASPFHVLLLLFHLLLLRHHNIVMSQCHNGSDAKNVRNWEEEWLFWSKDSKNKYVNPACSKYWLLTLEKVMRHSNPRFTCISGYWRPRTLAPGPFTRGRQWQLRP